MNRKSLLFIVLAFLSFSSTIYAKDEHTEAAFKQARDAALSTNAESISSHALKALKHTQSAMAVNKRYQTIVNHIQQSEIHLKLAIDLASKGDTAGAIQHASEAKEHLQKANAENFDNSSNGGVKN